MKDVLRTIGIKVDMTKNTKITIQNKQITVSKRNEPDKNLGKPISINGKTHGKSKRLFLLTKIL